MKTTNGLFLPGLMLAFAGGAFAQGTDCSNAIAINGIGSTQFDTTGFPESDYEVGTGCSLALGTTYLSADGFFQWTATVAGDMVFDTNGSNFDTQLALYSGTGCIATCIEVDDDDGIGLDSLIQLPGVTVGQTILVQIGGYNGQSGMGVLNVSFDPCSGANDDAYEDNEDCATAAPIGAGTYTGLFASKADKDHYVFCVDAGATVVVDLIFSHSIADVDGFLRDAQAPECGTGNGANELADGFSANDNESFSWTNTTGSELEVVLEVNIYPASSGTCNTYDLILSGVNLCGGGGGVGTPFCNPMNPNSTGASTTLTGTFGSGVGSGLHLEATQGPPNRFGYFLIGTAPSDPGITLSNGRLCMAITGGNQFGRYNVIGGNLNSVGQFSAGGVLQNFVGTSTVGTGFDVPNTIPITGSPQIQPGSTWHFQLWHREASGASNFSNGLSVMF